MDEKTFNGTFWISIAGIISALIIALIAGFNKSKCVSVNCCGLKCIRDVAKEVEVEEHRIDAGIPETPTRPPATITF